MQLEKLYSSMILKNYVNIFFLLLQWWKRDGTLCQQFNLKGVQAKSIHVSPDFKTFVSVDNVGMIYVLKRINSVT